MEQVVYGLVRTFFFLILCAYDKGSGELSPFQNNYFHEAHV